ncbi:M24 family metallopeptidase [Acinetobacter sp. BSP-153]|uniref:M24 family metallopeptidase n=1 Tax=Acinetobacter sp. BSP-153 TaxID=3344663 RepID=UPI0037702061
MAIGYKQKPQGVLEKLYRFVSEQGSKLTPNTDDVLLKDAQDGFRKAQRIAYDCVTEVGKKLHHGMTEIEAADLLDQYLKAAGCDRYIHRPFAWFGEHTRFDPYQGYGEYHPSDKQLKQGDVVILDVSPVVNGYTADVGYTTSLERHEELKQAQDFLLNLRTDLPRMFESSMTPKEIWAAVDRKIADEGYDNIHAKYPFCVLGHRVFKIKKQAAKAKRIQVGSMGWFSVETNLKFLKTGFNAALSPENVGSKIGLWAIEPHIGWAGAGAKFEEILVVDHQGARWLDNDVPHMQSNNHVVKQIKKQADRQANRQITKGEQ